jgi:hypothetical protein
MINEQILKANINIAYTYNRMTIKNLPGGKGRPARKADNLTASYELIVQKIVSLEVSQSYGPLRPVKG